MTRKNFAGLLNNIFGWGILMALIAGAMSFFGFLAALMMGGKGGETFAIFLQKQYFPLLIRFTSIIIGIGLLAMYAGKEQALSLVSDKQNAEQELAEIKSGQ